MSEHYRTRVCRNRGPVAVPSVLLLATFRGFIFDRLFCIAHIGALMIRIGFGGILY